MAETVRFALKKLTRSDLTLFDVQYRRQNAGNQKSVNLTREVFVDVLFPIARMKASGGQVRFPCELRIFGPEGITPPTIVQRKILAKTGTQKNWRLNGETVHADPDAPRPDRFDDLHDGDLAIFGFDGDEVPTAVTMVLLSSTHPDDNAPYRAAVSVLSAKSMMALEEMELAKIVDFAPPSHPLRELLDEEMDAATEEAALGSVEALEKLGARSIRRSTHEALARAKADAERIGREGEVLVREYLAVQCSEGAIAGFRWEADLNATHPFDFTITRSDGSEYQVEVKTTTRDHDRIMMFSHAEVAYAAQLPELEVLRLSRLTDIEATLRKSKGFGRVACDLLKMAGGLQSGISPSAWTIAPSALADWTEPLAIRMPDNDGD